MALGSDINLVGHETLDHRFRRIGAFPAVLNRFAPPMIQRKGVDLVVGFRIERGTKLRESIVLHLTAALPQRPDIDSRLGDSLAGPIDDRDHSPFVTDDFRVAVRAEYRRDFSLAPFLKY